MMVAILSIVATLVGVHGGGALVKRWRLGPLGAVAIGWAIGWAFAIVAICFAPRFA